MALKETMDLFQLVDTIATAKINAMRDGTVDWRDTPKLAPVVGAMISAFKGSDKIKGELEHMTKEEVEQLVAKAIETIDLCRQAILA